MLITHVLAKITSDDGHKERFELMLADMSKFLDEWTAEFRRNPEFLEKLKEIKGTEAAEAIMRIVFEKEEGAVRVDMDKFISERGVRWTFMTAIKVDLINNLESYKEAVEKMYHKITKSFLKSLKSLRLLFESSQSATNPNHELSPEMSESITKLASLEENIDRNNCVEIVALDR